MTAASHDSVKIRAYRRFPPLQKLRVRVQLQHPPSPPSEFGRGDMWQLSWPAMEACHAEGAPPCQIFDSQCIPARERDKGITRGLLCGQCRRQTSAISHSFRSAQFLGRCGDGDDEYSHSCTKRRSLTMMMMMMMMVMLMLMPMPMLLMVTATIVMSIGWLFSYNGCPVEICLNRASCEFRVLGEGHRGAVAKEASMRFLAMPSVL